MAASSQNCAILQTGKSAKSSHRAREPLKSPAAARLATERAAPHRAAAATVVRMPAREGNVLSILYGGKPSLTLAELLPAWAAEIATEEIETGRVERDLTRLLIDDIVRGDLDDRGPLEDDLLVGVKFIKSDGAVIPARGHDIGAALNGEDMIPERFKRFCHRIIVMKEAVLDFARRRELPPPLWWSAETPAPGAEAPFPSHAVDPDLLTQASDRVIREAIQEAYDTKKAAGEKPPNVKELARQVQPLLEERGYKTSARHIETIGGEPGFKKLRRIPGKTLRSERARKK